MNDVFTQYQQRLTEWSDIQLHLPFLFEQAKGNVLELGVRGGNSTAALLAGVVEHGGHLYSVDINPHCWGAIAANPQWTFITASSLDTNKVIGAGVPPMGLDVLFIDTVHTYEHTLQELNAWGDKVKVGGKIILHDTDDNDTYPGVRMAIINYCALHNLMFWLYPGSNGLGVIEA